MAIRTYIKNGKKLFEVYVNGFNAQGKRVQQKRRGLESLRKAEQVEFELKRKLAQLKENKVHPTWDEWLTECLQLMKVAYRPSTLYSVEKTLSKWVKDRWDKRDLSSITRLDVHEFICHLKRACIHESGCLRSSSAFFRWLLTTENLHRTLVTG